VLLLFCAGAELIFMVELVLALCCAARLFSFDSIPRWPARTRKPSHNLCSKTTILMVRCQP
jgi:hypothetical protein